MQIAYRWINRDLGKLEFVFAIIFISICLSALINKSLELFSLTEKRLVEATISNIQTALQLQLAVQSFNTSNEISLREGINPVNLMQSPPGDYKKYLGSGLEYIQAKKVSIKPMPNYLGEMLDPDIESLERGNWYFDHNGKLLIYLVKHPEYLTGKSNEFKELKFTVKLDYNDVNNNQIYEPKIDTLIAVDLVNVDRKI